MAPRWHILRDGPVLTLARHLPARFDVVAGTCLPASRRLRLASQIRQDLWRALRRQRGFSPVVQVTAGDTGMSVRAGGRLQGCRHDRRALEARIQALLEDRALRQRWARGASEGRP